MYYLWRNEQKCKKKKSLTFGHNIKEGENKLLDLSLYLHLHQQLMGSAPGSEPSSIQAL